MMNMVVQSTSVPIADRSSPIMKSLTLRLRACSMLVGS